MDFVLSGLAEKACWQGLGIQAGPHPQAHWVTASSFVDAAQGISPNEDARQWVWLYRAPWKWLISIDTAEVEPALKQWLVQQREILRLRRHLGQQLILVNVDQVAAALLCSRLDLPEPASVVIQPEPTALATVMAILFEQMAPHYWDVFEALEAAAWLPVGEAQFRHNILSPTEADLFDLLHILRNGLALPAYQAELTESHPTAVNQLEQRLADTNQQFELVTEKGAHLEHALSQSKQATIQSEADRLALAKENHLLLEQLHQTQETLEKHYLDNKAQVATLTDSHAATIKQYEQQLANANDQLEQVSAKRAQLDQSLNQSKQANTLAENKCKVLSEENDLLLTQLHHAQEELESYYLANQEFRAAMGQTQKTLRRTRNLVSRLVSNG